VRLGSLNPIGTERESGAENGGYARARYLIFHRFRCVHILDMVGVTGSIPGRAHQVSIIIAFFLTDELELGVEFQLVLARLAACSVSAPPGQDRQGRRLIAGCTRRSWQLYRAAPNPQKSLLLRGQGNFGAKMPLLTQ
jgi:hypothetical protein